MGWFSNWFGKKKRKESNQTSAPQASYDLYNNGQTQNVNSYESNSLLVAYEETLAQINEAAEAASSVTLDLAGSDDSSAAPVEAETPVITPAVETATEPLVPDAAALASSAPEVTELTVEADLSSDPVPSTAASIAKPRPTNYYVSLKKDPNGNELWWEVKKGKNVLELCSSRESAMSLVENLAAEDQVATCTIRVDGAIQEKRKFGGKK